MPATLRPAPDDELSFARGLYLDNIREVSQRTGSAWDEVRQTAGFDARFVASEVSIIVLSGEDIGWVQIAVRAHPSHQRRGIGTRLLGKLMQRAKRQRKLITLGIAKAARPLYERPVFMSRRRINTRFAWRRAVRRHRRGSLHSGMRERV